MRVGRECRRSIVEAVLLPMQPAQVEPDVTQLDFFRLPDLLQAAEAQAQA